MNRISKKKCTTHNLKISDDGKNELNEKSYSKDVSGSSMLQYDTVEGDSAPIWQSSEHLRDQLNKKIIFSHSIHFV